MGNAHSKLLWAIFRHLRAIMCNFEKTLNFFAQLNPLDDIPKFMSNVMFILCMIGQLWLPCYNASRLTQKSEQLPTRIFACNWIDQSRSFKSSMRIFISQGIRPIIPRAGGLFEVGLPIFVTVPIPDGLTFFI